MSQTRDGNTTPVHSRSLIAAAFFIRNLSATETLTLMALCSHWPRPIPAVSTIAAEARLSKSQAQRCLKSLQKKKLINIEKRRSGRYQATNFYHINADLILLQSAKAARKQTTKETVSQAALQNVRETSCQPATECQADTPQSVKDSRQPMTPKQIEEETELLSSNRSDLDYYSAEEEQELESYQVYELERDPNTGAILTEAPNSDREPKPSQGNKDVQPCQEGLQKTSGSEEPSLPHPPSSAAPPSPSLPLSPDEALADAIRLTAKLRKKGIPDPYNEEWFYRGCEKYGPSTVIEALKDFIHNNSNARHGQPLRTFTEWSIDRMCGEIKKRKGVREQGEGAASNQAAEVTPNQGAKITPTDLASLSPLEAFAEAIKLTAPLRTAPDNVTDDEFTQYFEEYGCETVIQALKEFISTNPNANIGGHPLANFMRFGDKMCEEINKRKRVQR